MRKRQRKGLFLSKLVLIIVVLFCLFGCVSKANNTNDIDSTKDKISTIEDLNGHSIVTVVGSVQEKLALENFPDSEISYNSDYATCIVSVETNKADFTIMPELQYETCKDGHPSLIALYPALVNTGIYFGAAKNDISNKYLNELNEYINSLNNSGDLKTLVEKWNDSEYDNYFDFNELVGVNGTVNYASTVFDRPYFFKTNELYGGIEAEILYDFAKEYGYNINVSIVEAASVLTGLSTGRFNIAGTLVYTEERAEKIDYSVEYAVINQVVVCNQDILKDIPMYRDKEDLSGKKVAVSTGTFEEEQTYKYLPDSEYQHYSSFVDCLLAVSGEKVEATLLPVSQLPYALENYNNLTYQRKVATSVENCFAISKTDFGSKIQQQLNNYINSLKKSGELDEIWNYWCSVDSNSDYKSFDFSELDSTNGTISFVVEPLSYPRMHIYKDKFAGYEAEIIYNFAKEYGYGVDCNVIEFSSILTGLYASKYDISAYVHYTEERAQNVLFSIPYDYEDLYCVVRKANNSVIDETGLLNKISSSFEKNFVREDRWKLLLDGLKVTVLITLLTAIFGTLFGVLLCLLRRSGLKLINTITKVFIRIVQGIPIVVLLLVLYYIIFAKSAISGITVGVIGFSLDFGVYVSEILRSSIEAIDVGQWEAASALGFNKVKTYLYIVIPQALRYALPVYKGQFISMVKMTSVIGYVAVQDLTKVSDIIRSRTYDAFMPIIITAIIYFVIAWILTSLLSLIEIKTDPRKRKNMLDGINVDINIDKPIKSQNTLKINNGEDIIEIKHLRKEYSNAVPLMDINTTIKKGDIISIIGPSGTGKSTLIRMLNRLEEPTSGEIFVFNKLVDSKNKEIYSLRSKIGMVFQSFNLFNHLTVIENLMIAPVIIKGITKQEAYEKGMYLLKRVGLVEKALNYPSELSGGQKQRVAIVRALMMDPEVILLDEPTSALDPAMINEVLHVIEDLASTGMTMLIVTHELKFAQKVANRVFYLDEGGIYEEGSSYEIFNNPQKEKTKAFIKRLKVFTLDIDSKNFDFISLRSKLETFGYQQMIQGRVNNSMILCTEELFTLGIAKLDNDSFPANITIEYDENSVLNIEFKYNGKKKNILDELDDISINIVKSLTESIEYSFNENINEIKLIIK